MIKQLDCVIPNPNNAVTDDVVQFVKSGAKTCEIDVSGYATVQNGRSAYATVVWRRGLSSKVKVCQRNGSLYLIRKDI